MKSDQKPTNIEVGNIRSGDSFSVSCEFDGARYHFWMDLQTQEPGDILYKNPPLGLARSDPGYFDTRTLTMSGAIGRTIVPAMLAAVPVLLPLAMEAEKQKKAAEEAEHQEAIRIRRIKEAGPKLLDALNAAKDHYIDTHAVAYPEDRDLHPLLVLMDEAIDAATMVK